MSYLPKPELVALRVLERIGAKSTPINLLKVAKLWTGLEVAEENIENEGYMIDLGIQGGEIIIRSQNIQTRKNYTLAHELGHWILKKEYAAREGYGENKNKNSSIERWCDQFAAELLMPKDWLMRDIRSTKISGLIKTIRELPSIYGVSEQAMRIRISKVVPVTIYEITTEKELPEIRQKYESKKYNKGELASLEKFALSVIRKRSSGGNLVTSEKDYVSVSALLKRKDKKNFWLVCSFYRNFQKANNSMNLTTNKFAV